MTDNNIDTPQSANPNDANEAFESPWPGTAEDSSNTSVEDAFFGGQDTEQDQDEASPVAGTPETAPMQ